MHRGALLTIGRDDHEFFRSVFLFMPLRQPIGFLAIFRKAQLTLEEEINFARILQLYNNFIDFLDYGDYDELTGLLNRKTFDSYFRNVIENLSQRPVSSRYIRGSRFGPSDNEHVWLAVADIDFFKKINDKFGHLYGDEVLVLLSQIMRKSFRESDSLFRCGGEEFVIVLRCLKPEHASVALERFRCAVEDFGFPQVGKVTVSIGYTAVRREDSGSAAFGRADEALYLAKHSGRNQVQFYENLVEGNLLNRTEPTLNDVELF
jgi:diguanylate cyclase (GGDEF)-like protein